MKGCEWVIFQYFGHLYKSVKKWRDTKGNCYDRNKYDSKSFFLFTVPFLCIFYSLGYVFFFCERRLFDCNLSCKFVSFFLFLHLGIWNLKVDCTHEYLFLRCETYHILFRMLEIYRNLFVSVILKKSKKLFRSSVCHCQRKTVKNNPH